MNWYQSLWFRKHTWFNDNRDSCKKPKKRLFGQLEFRIPVGGEGGYNYKHTQKTMKICHIYYSFTDMQTQKNDVR